MRRIAVCVPSISPNSLMKLSALTFSTARICVFPVSRLMAPWILSRSLSPASVTPSRPCRVSGPRFLERSMRISPGPYRRSFHRKRHFFSRVACGTWSRASAPAFIFLAGVAEAWLVSTHLFASRYLCRTGCGFTDAGELAQNENHARNQGDLRVEHIIEVGFAVTWREAAYMR